MKPRCVITAFDGFDWEVTVNLICFYRCCGFEVRVSPSVPPAAELLVIQRGCPPPGTVFEGQFDRCHIYDYVGQAISAQFFPRAEIVRAFPFVPVIPALWMPRQLPRRRSHRLVHIGHVKPGLGSDRWQRELEMMAAAGHCECFGDGWSNGAVSLHTCLQLYRDAAFALGIQYPFQRGEKISSRMWQAPLSGCLLFSEAVPDGVALPGVRQVNSYREALDAVPVPTIAEEAETFWHDATARLAETLGLRYQPPSKLAAATLYLRGVYRGHVRQGWLTLLSGKQS